MKIEEVEGIILSETNYSESSKILNILTKEHNIIGVISKGCRNIKSKLRAVSRKLVYGKFHIYYKENGLSTLISVDIMNSFHHILTDLKTISYASYIIDLVLQVSKQNEEDNLFSLLKATLLKTEEGYGAHILMSIVELKLLDYLGVKPMIDGCSLCGSNKNIVTISSSKGGYICAHCYTDEGMVSDKTIQLVRMFYYVDLEKITKLEVSSHVLKEINLFLEDYYDRYTGLFLKSKKFLKELEKIEQV